MGAPAFTVPILGFVIPEIALFKNVRHSGHTEVEVFTVNGGNGKSVDKSPPAIGETNYDMTIRSWSLFTSLAATWKRASGLATRQLTIIKETGS